jgi:hypothetical protein
VNGNEADGNPQNVGWACRSCNVRIGNVIRRAGMGRKTREYSPTIGTTTLYSSNASGAESLGQWLNAVLSLRGEGGTMSVADAVAMVHATPMSDRSRFAREIWNKRRQRHGPTGRKENEVPF